MNSNFEDLVKFDFNQLAISSKDSDICRMKLHYRGEGNSSMVLQMTEVKKKNPDSD